MSNGYNSGLYSSPSRPPALSTLCCYCGPQKPLNSSLLESIIVHSLNELYLDQYGETLYDQPPPETLHQSHHEPGLATTLLTFQLNGPEPIRGLPWNPYTCRIKNTGQHMHVQLMQVYRFAEYKKN